MILRTNSRLKNFEDCKTLNIVGSIFHNKVAGDVSENEVIGGKGTCEKETDLAEIQKMILDDDSGDEEDLDKMLSDGFPIEIDDTEDVINLEGEAIFNNASDQSEVEGMEEDDEIEIIEIIEAKRQEKALPDIKNEVKKEQVEEETGGEELPPTPSPSEPLDLYELKLEVEVEISAEVVAPSEEEDSVTLNKFCRICYHTFSKDVEQLAHERRVHNNEEDQNALNLKTTSLTIEDFVHSCNLCGLKFITNNCLKIHSKKMHRIGLEMPEKCKVCRENVTKEDMKKHMKTQHGQVFLHNMNGQARAPAFIIETKAIFQLKITLTEFGDVEL